MAALPEGFVARAVAKVVGLAPGNNQTHAAIWAALSALHKSTLSYQFSTVEQVFPQRKPKVGVWWRLLGPLASALFNTVSVHSVFTNLTLWWAVGSAHRADGGRV
jgi:hypothetical protein